MLGSRVNCGGRGAPFLVSHRVSPCPQAAGSPGQQAQPPAECHQQGHSPGQQGHHGGCGDNVGVSLRTLDPPHSHSNTEGLTCGWGRFMGAMAGDPMNGRPGLGGQLAEAA